MPPMSRLAWSTPVDHKSAQPRSLLPSPDQAAHELAAGAVALLTRTCLSTNSFIDVGNETFMVVMRSGYVSISHGSRSQP